MDVHKSSLLSIFDAKQRLEVPLFQRQYVWDQEQQWLPLWEDISRKFTECLEGRENAPVHFLGAMVLDQKHTPTGHVVVRQVIDGQQRLTTLQLFLAAYRDFCRSQDCPALAAECDKFIFNTGMMADGDIDRFKVWPTQLDRSQFRDVVESGSRAEVERRHPLVKRRYGRKYLPRPLMVEAYLFFYEQLADFFLGMPGEEPIAPNYPVPARLDECFQTLRRTLMVVVIDLQVGDDPQVIFETLNARGEPLLPADLLRNYVFFRANAEGLDVDAAYKRYWSAFDQEFWRQKVKQGRLIRPRSDLFIQHFLASHQGQDIPIKHLYVEYRYWIERQKPFHTVEEELATLSRQGAQFRRIAEPKPDDIIFELTKFLDTYDIRTAYPLLLAMLDSGLDEDEWGRVARVLESFLLRRAICGWPTKNYNKIFLGLTRTLRRDGFSSANLRATLLSQTGESAAWPDDSVFREKWMHSSVYGALNSPKLVHLLKRLNQTYMSSRAEAVAFSVAPTVEHIMPQAWQEHWRLADGSKGLDHVALYKAEMNDAVAIATRARNDKVQTIGNMTILSTGLNSAQSNSPWEIKRGELMKHSLLPINLQLTKRDTWTDDAIVARGAELFQRALLIWPR